MTALAVGILSTLSPFPATGAAEQAKKTTADEFSREIADLSNPNAGIRYRTCVALGRLGDARAVVPLTKALKDPEAEVRSWCAFALRAIAASTDSPDLIAALGPLVGALGDKEAEVRGAAAGALGGIVAKKVVEPLTALQKDPDSGVALDAEMALGLIRGEGRTVIFK